MFQAPQKTHRHSCAPKWATRSGSRPARSSRRRVTSYALPPLPLLPLPPLRARGRHGAGRESGAQAVTASFLVGAALSYLAVHVLDRKSLTMPDDTLEALPEWMQEAMLPAETAAAMAFTGLTVFAFGPGRLLIVLLFLAALGFIIWAHRSAASSLGPLSLLPPSLRAQVHA
jgi:hypothetical protein